MSVPLRGQGAALPPDFPYEGEWLDEPRIFLYAPTDARRSGHGAPQFTAEINPTADDWSVGFNAHQLAAALGITVQVLFAGNQTGDLMLENVEANTKTGEGATAKRYTFRLGEKTGAMIIERLAALGRA